MNSFDSILTRLRQGVGDGISTMEGTFAGDLLQAMANELARIYSQEMDTIYQRAFVATAEGAWLTAACADYGVDRREEETDDSLRQRTLQKIRQQASSGNEAHYQAWALELDGVAAAQARGLIRGPGTVDVYIVPQDPEAGQQLLDTVAAHIAGLRPVCVDVQVSYAAAQALDVSAVLTLQSGATPEGVALEFAPLYQAYLAQVALTEQGSVISLHQIAALLLRCSGVLDVSDIMLGGKSESARLSSGVYATPGTVTFTEAVVL